MKLTKKEDYTFFLISRLAKTYKGEPISLTNISLQSGISVFFLKQLVRPLLKKRLIESKEGVHGGYKLTKDPSKITLLEIFKAIGTLPRLTSCCVEPCKRDKYCRPRELWRDLNEIIIDKLAKTNLAEFV